MDEPARRPPGLRAFGHLLHASKLTVLQSHGFQFLRNHYRFPGLAVDPSVKIANRGSIKYGVGVAIDEGSNIIVPEGGVLSLGDNCRVGRFVELGPISLIRLGRDVSIQDRCVILGDVHIGQHSFLSLNVLMTSGNHFYEHAPEVLMRDQDQLVATGPNAVSQLSSPIVVEEDCWIGFNAVIKRGVTLGRGSIVGANAVVTRDVMPYTVVAGAPAKVIKERLAFRPPASINWDRQADLPYFYRGFDLTINERSGNAALGGHVARGDFAVWVAAQHAGTAGICVNARSLGARSVLTGVGGAEHELGPDWRAIRLTSASSDRPIEVVAAGAPVIVNSVAAK